jgi:uncharacterized protein (DUF1501 family)
MLRRHWIQAGALAAGMPLLALGHSAWAALHGAAPDAAAQRRLVVVFMRGAVDGLSVVAPYADAEYVAARPGIALMRPGSDNAAIDLDGYFGLHPALAPLMPWWQRGQLGFVHASGSPDPTRSHFDAQDYMESATPGRKSTAEGWLNRLLGVLPQQASPNRAVSVGPVLPRIFAGTQAVANLSSGASAAKPTLLDKPQVGSAFDRLYAGDDRLARAYQASRESHRDVMASLEQGDVESEMMAANNGAALPNGFTADAARLARLMRNDPRVQLAFMAVGGWDTHAAQGAGTGQLANRLRPLGQGLAALADGLGPALQQTVIVVMSEFGRTVRQNGNGGTDHGHGNVMWLLGGSVAGGRVHGRWPGLDSAALYEGRDLAVTTDFRAVLASVAALHLQLNDGQLSAVFPGYTGISNLALFRA